jgi:AcrR family transcriptional regulator
MARPKGDAAVNAARKREILKAAFDVFSRDGYQGSSLSQISEIVGMTEAGILHHFKTKANLLTAVLDYRDEASRGLVDGFNTDGIGFVKAWLNLVSYNISAPGIVELFCVVSAESTSANHPAHQFFKKRYAETIAMATEAMTDLQKNNYIRKDVDPEDLGRALIALSDGLQVQWLLDRNWDMLEEQKSFFRRILHPKAQELAGLAIA